jgi:hypothetical protein
MALKKLSLDRVRDADHSPVSVLLEPKPGMGDEDVVSLLNEVGAERVAILAEGFISAVAPRSCLARIEAVAVVHIKPLKELHAI